MKEKPYVVIGERNSMLLHQYGTLDSFRHKIPGTKWDIPKTFIYAKNLRGAHCYHEPTRRRMLEILIKELKKDVYKRSFFNRIHLSFQKTLKDVKSFANKDFSSCSAGILANYYLRYYKMYQLVFLPMMVAIYSSDLQDFFEQELEKVLKLDENKPEDIVEIISFLLTSPKLTEVQKEEEDKLLISKKFVDNFKKKGLSRKNFDKFFRDWKMDNQLNKLEVDHGWFHQEYVSKAKKKDDYKREIWENIKTNRNNLEIFGKNQLPSFRLKIARLKQQEFFRKHKKVGTLRKTVLAMQEFSLLLDYSKADLIHGVYLARPLIDEIKKRFSLANWIDVYNLTPQEVISALKRGKLTSKERDSIKERRKEFSMLYNNGKITIFHGKRARRMKEELLRQEETTGISEFSGLVAMTGNVEGVAKIIISAQDTKGFRKGDIMITNEVTTELTSVLKKAAAIVADGGGIISHTAIVAREFKIPCVVGTKVATKILKNGDQIMIDASGSKGVVKKI